MLCVASTGIASLLLPGGRTAHNHFRIPFDLPEESSCFRTQFADLLCQASLIIWDGATTMSRVIYAPHSKISTATYLAVSVPSTASPRSWEEIFNRYYPSFVMGIVPIPCRVDFNSYAPFHCRDSVGLHN